MRAVVQDEYGEADVLRVEEVPAPEPGRGEVLVRVRAAGVDQGVWHLMAGVPGFIRVATGLRRPRQRVPGLDLAGVVERVGPGVTRWRPGDEVFGTGRGTFAEVAVAREDALCLRPEGASAEQAAATPVSGCAALHALRDEGRVRSGQRVLVLGAGGGVGSFAVQLARAFGAHVTGVCSTGKVAFVRGLGADAVIDYEREAITGAFDLVIDTGGHRAIRDLRLLAPRGTVVLVGSETGGPLAGFGRTLRAAALSPFVPQRFRMLSSRERAEDLGTLAGFIDSGAVIPALDRVVPLQRAADAIRDLRAGRIAGKAVVSIAG